jgi:putative SOS response-associated peptidase YedK
MADGSVFGLAGLYERWRGDDDTVLDTCTIVTTEANALVRPVHDRMPLIVAPEHYARWLDPGNADVADLIVPYPATAMACYPISARVNSERQPSAWVTSSVRHDAATLLDRVDPFAGEPAGDHEPPPHPPEQESLF